MDGLSSNQFKRFHINGIPIVQYLLTFKILRYDKDIVDRKNIGQVNRRSVKKYERTVQLMRCNNHIQ